MIFLSRWRKVRRLNGRETLTIEAASVLRGTAPEDGEAQRT